MYFCVKLLFMKNLLLGFIVTGLIIVGGYYLFKEDPKSSDTNIGITDVNLYGTTTPVFEDGTLPPEGNITNSEQGTNTTNTNKKTRMITIDTNYGKIVFETYDNDAPNTVKNFVTLA